MITSAVIITIIVAVIRWRRAVIVAIRWWSSPYFTVVQASIRVQPPTRGSVLVIFHKCVTRIAPMAICSFNEGASTIASLTVSLFLVWVARVASFTHAPHRIVPVVFIRNKRGTLWINSVVFCVTTPHGRASFDADFLLYNCCSLRINARGGASIAGYTRRRDIALAVMTRSVSSMRRSVIGHRA